MWHRLPCGKLLTVKAGTQIIDRAWRELKRHLGPRTYDPHSTKLAAFIRSAQWCYWHRGDDLWPELGKVVKSDLESKFQK